MKKSIACLLILCMMVALLAGCGSAPTAPAEEPKAEEPAPAEEPKAEEAAAPVEAEPEGEDEENYETGDASLDDPLNQDGIGEKELLVVSFGTSFNDNRRLTIGAIEKSLQTGFPEWSVREALDRAIANGVKILVVQPTHLMAGFEYTDLKNELAEYADAFDQIVLSNPLLVTDEDFRDVAEAIVSATAEYDDGKTAICFMGHGTEADSNGVYAKMQTVLTEMGMDNYFIGTVEAVPSVDDVLAQVQSGDYSRVVLRPLMIVAGDHANNDMAGDDEDSWKSIFEGAGYEVECVVEGLGQLEAIQELILAHAADMISQVK